MDNSRRLNYPQLKSERARKLLEAQKPSWIKRHPLVSTAALVGPAIISILLISKSATLSEAKVDADSARVSVSANASNASKTKDRWEQLKTVLKMRKELKGKIPRGSPVEDGESALSAEQIKQKLFSMNAAEFDEYRQDLEDELEEVNARMGELDSLWPNMSEAQWEELAQLRKRSEELKTSRWIATEENIGRGTETILASGIEWRGRDELLDSRREYLRMQSDGWNGKVLQGEDADYVNRMLVVLNWAIDARKQGVEPLQADLLFFRPDYVN